MNVWLDLEFELPHNKLNPDSSAADTGYDKGDSKHDMAFHEALQEAINELVGW